MACETSTASVAALGLSCVQKLAANDALSPTHVPSVVRAIGAQADSSPDESVHLRCLQASLTILQSITACPTDPNAISDLIAPCFRLAAPRGGGSRGSPAARSAAATARQVADIVFARARPDPSDARADDLGVVADENAAALSRESERAERDSSSARERERRERAPRERERARERERETPRERESLRERAAENALRRRGDDESGERACRRAVTEDLCAPLLARFAAWNAEEGDESSPTEGRASLFTGARARRRRRCVASRPSCATRYSAPSSREEVERARVETKSSVGDAEGGERDAERERERETRERDEDEDAREEGDEDARG